MRNACALALALTACSGEEPGPSTTDTTEPQGACGDVSSIDVSITGTVEDGDGTFLSGVSVWLEERNWNPGTIHGEATSDGAGSFTFQALGLPVVEDCWGTAVQFYLVGETDTLSGEKPMNSPIFNAYDDGSYSVDLGAFGLIVD